MRRVLEYRHLPTGGKGMKVTILDDYQDVVRPAGLANAAVLST